MTNEQLSDAAKRWWWVAMLLIAAFAIVLRLKGIHDPILDHPGWRQGDTASIARNFARLQFNIMYPQTTYNGPPPNYVELELQIVPFIAAALYKIFGVHEVFGRLISLAFSVGTVVVVGLFARWLFSDALAGLLAALVYAMFPGSVYYGRTFTPDGAMVFFLTAALYSATRLLVEDESLAPRRLFRTTALVALAYLAKPVAVLGIVPLVGVVIERIRAARPSRPTALIVLLFVPLLILYLYDRRVASYAEWHWASGITSKHVIPSLLSAFSSGDAFVAKLTAFKGALGMLRETMLGTISFVLAVLSFVALPWIQTRSRALLWGWLIAGLAYAFVVVTVERVDYYLYPLLPLCALVIGAALSALVSRILAADAAPVARYAILALIPLVLVAAFFTGHSAIKPYYRYNKQAYRNAVALSHSLPQTLIVIGHYGPDVQYYIDRFGWEEDPYLWTPFDEQSAIRKGARVFISIEDNRFRKNLELCAWMQRFPVVNAAAQWPVYRTDPALVSPQAEILWRAFRRAERDGHGRAFLDAHHLCRLRTKASPQRVPI